MVAIVFLSLSDHPNRGYGIAFYSVPTRSESTYEYAFRSINKVKTITTYCCCACRALKDNAPPAFGKFSYIHISHVNFITDPDNLMNTYLCTSRSLTRALARCETTDVSNYLRENANMTPKKAQHTLLKRVIRNNAQRDYYRRCADIGRGRCV
uniref:RRM domain-containing protein n=1 Tax=Heterorhabditis bacteriophora TaxID=37862 RepID=A0A1I7WHV9_HETBA